MQGTFMKYIKNKLAFRNTHLIGVDTRQLMDRGYSIFCVLYKNMNPFCPIPFCFGRTDIVGLYASIRRSITLKKYAFLRCLQ